MLKSLFPWKHNKTKVMAAEQTMDSEVIVQKQNLEPCHVCGRTFLPTPLRKHEKVCEKNAVKRRKVFNSLKQRVEGTDLALFHQKSYLKRPVEVQPPIAELKTGAKQSKWKEKHLELVNAIRAAKGATTSNNYQTPKKLAPVMAGTERCPSCDRQFGPKSFDRHVEWCKERQTRIQHSPANVLLAKERLEARTKYRVPPIKSKRSVTREKYSLNSPTTESVPNIPSTKSNNATPVLQRGPSVRKPKSLVTLVGRVGEKEGLGKVEKLHTPKIESTKSFHTKRTLPSFKINTPQINKEQDFLTVSSINCGGGKKMVTWKDTVEKNRETSNKNASSHSCKVYNKTRSLECEKILSSDDVLFKNCDKSSNNFALDQFQTICNRFQDAAIISDESIPCEAIDLSLNESEVVVGQNGSSCDSLVAAIGHLQIDSQKNVTKQENAEVSEDLDSLEGSFDSNASGDKDLSTWFQSRFNEEKCDSVISGEVNKDNLECEQKENNVIFLFQSTNESNHLSDGNSNVNLQEHQSWSTIQTSANTFTVSERVTSPTESENLLLYLDCKSSGCLTRKSTSQTILLPLKERYLTKSCSEIALGRSDLDFFTKASVEEIYNRHDILRLAAEEFIHDHYSGESKKTVGGNLWDEDYSVPKKRRKLDVSDEETIGEEEQPLGDREVVLEPEIDYAVSNFDKVEASDVHDRGDYEKSAKPSRSSSAAEIYSPRLLVLFKKLINNFQGVLTSAKDSETVLELTKSDCCHLIDLDCEKLPKILSNVRKKTEGFVVKEKKHLEDVKLPSLVGGKDQLKHRMVQVPSVESSPRSLQLPQLGEKLLRRGSRVGASKGKDLKRDISGVYLDYADFCQRNSNATPNYDPFESAQRQFMELLECDDFKPFTATCNPIQHTPRPHTTSNTPVKPAEKAVKKTVKSASKTKAKTRSSIIDPPVYFKDSMDSVNDDFEMIENMINENFSEESYAREGLFLDLNSVKAPDESGNNNDRLNLNDISNARKYSDDMSSIDPSLINENDNLSIPEHFKVDDYSPTSTIDTDITIQNENEDRDLDAYSLQYDSKIAEIEPKVDKKPLFKRSLSSVDKTSSDRARVNSGSSLKITSKKITTKSGKIVAKSNSSVGGKGAEEKKKGLSTLKRSMTLFDPIPKPPSLKNRSEVDQYFSEKELKSMKGEQASQQEKDLPDIDSTLKPEDLFAVDDEMYEEYKKYEEMYLKDKEQKGKSTKKPKPKPIEVNFGLQTASEEEEAPLPANKLSNDSAYGSLNRKTPKHRNRTAKLSPLEQKHFDSTSSSGSENNPGPGVVTSSNTTNNNQQRLSKFCHECGSKYPVCSAKFCVECGVKRLVL